MCVEKHAVTGINTNGSHGRQVQPPAAPGSDVDWRDLVLRIRQGDASGLEELYRLFSRGIRYYLCRQLGPQDLDDKLHDTFLVVVHAIQKGDLREPERLMGFVRTVVRRQVAGHIDCMVQGRKEQLDLDFGSRVADSHENPEENAIDQQRTELMIKFLRGIGRRDREILTRFYLLDQPQELICQEMQLSETQFRLLKSRAKSRFAEFGRRKLSGAGAAALVFMRRVVSA